MKINVNAHSKKSSLLLSLGMQKSCLARLNAEGPDIQELDGVGLDTQDMPQKIVEAVRNSCCIGASICLGLPSEMVFSAEIECPTKIPRRQKHNTMLYRLEEQLPLNAEDLTADFLPPIGGRALGLSIETRKIAGLIDALCEAGFEVSAVCPTSLLSLWSAVHEGKVQADYILLQTFFGPGIDVFRMTGSQPVRWYSSCEDTAAVVGCIQADLLANPVETESPEGIAMGGIDDSTISAITEATGIRLTANGEQSPLQLASQAAGNLIAGQAAGWVDFRRDALAPKSSWGRLARPMQTAAVMGCILLVVLAGTFLWRGMQYDSISENYSRQQISEYQKLYKHGRVPTSIVSRLQSEAKRLAGKSGLQGVPTQVNALETLKQITGNLPANIRLRIVSMRMDDNGFLIQGQTRTHSDAELIVRAINNGGLSAQPPKSEQLANGGVSFTITGSVNGDSRLADAGGKR